MDSNQKSKKEVAKWMRRLYKKGLTTSLGGNISIRFDDEHILITSSETDKGKITANEIALVNMKGECVDSDLRISMETQMHLNIYKAKPDIKTVVHAHPVMSSAFSAMNKGINTKLLAEAYTIIGQPVVAGYALPGSPELAEQVAEVIQKSNVVLMENHGVLAVGESLLKAFDRIEVLENAAKMTLITNLMNDGNELSVQQLEVLQLSFK